jgi:hypothetical protein
MRNRIKAMITTAAAAATLAVGAGLTAAPAQADVIGCPPGWACIFAPLTAPLTDPHAFNPYYAFYTYGAHDIHNMYGVKAVCNQQTGYAVVRLYSGYGGTGTVLKTIPGSRYPGFGNCVDVNLDKVNSVRLSEH